MAIVASVDCGGLLSKETYYFQLVSFLAQYFQRRFCEDTNVTGGQYVTFVVVMHSL